MKEWEFRNKAGYVLQELLQSIPIMADGYVIEEKEVGDGLRPDYVVEMKDKKGKPFRLIIEAKTRGEPRLARGSINQLRRYQEMYPDSYPVFMAPYISERAAQICRSEEIGYLDLAGNCYLSFANVYIDRKGRKNPYSSERRLKSLYSRKASRILRVMISNPWKAWKLQDLAQEADVSVGLAHNVKNLLWEKEWLEKIDEGIQICDRASVLSGWIENYSIEKNKKFEFYSVKEIPDIEYGLASVCRNANVQYGLTGFSGAARWASVVRYKRIDSYVADNVERIAEKAELKPVDSGGNVRLFLPYDEGIFYGSTEIEGTRVVSPVQAYLDLKGMGGRAEEASQALLSQKVLASPEKAASSSETKRGE